MEKAAGIRADGSLLSAKASVPGTTD